MTNKISAKNALQWIISIGIPLLILLIPVNETFTAQMRLYLMITLIGILFFAFGNVKQTVVSFALPWAYVLTGVTTADVVFSPWATTTIWMFVGSFFLINALTRCGLLNRIAYKTIVIFGGTYHGTLLGLTIISIIIGLVTGGCGAVPMLALALGICKALNLEKFSKEATGIFLVAALGGCIPGYIFYNVTTILMINIGSSVGAPGTIRWFEHFFYGIPILVYFFLSVLLVAFLFPASKKTNAAENRIHFSQLLHDLGPMHPAEIKAIIIIGLMLLFMMTATITNIDASYGFIIFPLLLYLPGINVGTEEDLKAMDFGFVLFVAACLGIGMTGSALGFGELVSNTILPLLQDQGVWVFSGVVWLVCFVMNFLLTPFAIFASFSAPLATLSMQLGIHPFATYFIMLIGADQLIFPYECAFYLIFFSYGVIRMEDFVKYFSAKILLSLVVLFLITLPFYKLIGYLYL